MEKSVCDNCKEELDNSLMTAFVKDDKVMGLFCSNCVHQDSPVIDSIPEVVVEENTLIHADLKPEGHDIELFAQDIEILADVETDNQEDLDRAVAFFGEGKSSTVEKQKDLMYVKFKLVHANTNKNKDHFTREELKNAEKTPILKLLNWGHDQNTNIGVIYQSKYVESKENGEPDYLQCIAAISKYKFKTYAEQILNRYNKGELFFSMETWFKEAQCSVCDEVFSTGEEGYCNHLSNRLAEGSSAARILRQITFAGAAVVENPADVQAGALALASKKPNLKEGNIVDKIYSQAELDAAIEKAIAQAIANSNAETEKTALALKVEELDQLIQKYTKMNEDLTAQNTELLLQKEEIEKSVASVTEEFENFKSQVAAEKLATDRLAQLIAVGYTVPDKEDDAYAELMDNLRTASDKSFDFIKRIAEQAAKASENSTQANTIISNDDDNDIILTANAGVQDSNNRFKNVADNEISSAVRLAFGKR